MARSKRPKAFGLLLGKSFGAVVRKYREGANWSIEKLASEANVDRSYLGDVERGGPLPTLDIQFRLIGALGADTGELMGKMGTLVFRNFPRERPRSVPSTERIPLGEDTCPKCKATYTLHACRLSAPERRKFKCAFCKREISTSSGTTVLLYDILRPPKTWP
jgi:transcriptional regulator with XRE-family HTH domain